MLLLGDLYHRKSRYITQCPWLYLKAFHTDQLISSIYNISVSGKCGAQSVIIITISIYFYSIFNHSTLVTVGKTVLNDYAFTDATPHVIYKEFNKPNSSVSKYKEYVKFFICIKYRISYRHLNCCHITSVSLEFSICWI